MDPAATAAAGIALRTVTALIGQAEAKGDYDEAQRLRAKALDEYGTLDPSQLGKIDVQAGGTEFDKVQEDPTLREAQMMALRRMGEVGTETSPEDNAAYAQAQQKAGEVDRGIRGAALQRLASHGIGQNSGLAMAAQMDAAQQATNQNANAGLEQAAESRRRALSALGQYGQAAGSVRGDDYRKNQDRAAAQDSINKFNAGQRWTQGQGQYGAQLATANAKSGADLRASGGYQESGDKTAATWAGVGGAAADTVDAYGRKKDDL